MRYPPFLKSSGTIGFIAPAFGCAMEPYRSCFEEAKKNFSEMGFSLLDGPNCYASCGTGKSNTPRACGEEINDFFLRRPADVLISCGGGETMCEDLPYVDFDSIRSAPPKWFMGYSDNTNLTFTLPVLCDTAAVYGPCAHTFGMHPWHQALRDALDLLQGKCLQVSDYGGWESSSLKSELEPFVPYHITEPFRAVSVPPVSADPLRFSGRLIGGCLDCLINLCGTSFDRTAAFAEKYAGDGILWFLEACELDPLQIRRALWQLDNAGWFRNASGFLIGRPYLFEDEIFGVNRHSAVTEVLEKYNVPIVMDADIGHLPPMMPLIAGSVADVEFTGEHLHVSMHLV